MENLNLTAENAKELAERCWGRKPLTTSVSDGRATCPSFISQPFYLPCSVLLSPTWLAGCEPVPERGFQSAATSRPLAAPALTCAFSCPPPICSLQSAI